MYINYTGTNSGRNYGYSMSHPVHPSIGSNITTANAPEFESGMDCNHSNHSGALSINDEIIIVDDDANDDFETKQIVLQQFIHD